MLELTAELIADLPVPQDLDLSPDGRWVAYALVPNSKKEEHPTAALWIAATDVARPPRRFTPGTSEDRHSRWSSDGSQIAFLSDRAKRGTAQLYVIPADGGEARHLTGTDNKKGVDQFAWSPGGGHIAFTSADEPTAEDERREKERDDADVYGERWPYARLRLLSLATNEVATLAAPARHVAAFAWSPDGSEVAYLTLETPALESFAREAVVERISVAGGEPRTVCRLPRGVDSLVWSHDGQWLLYTASAGGMAQSSQAIYAVPAQGGEPRRIALGEESCAGGLQQPAGAKHVVALVGAGLETHIVWVDPATGVLAPLSPTSDTDRLTELWHWTVRVTESGDAVLAAGRSSPQQAWEIWAGRATGEAQVPALRQITTHQTALAGLTFGRQEPFTWTAPDGLALDGLLVRPPDAPPDHPLPTVVLVHGGPYGRWEPGCHLHWFDWAQWLALAGYAVLMPNIRGGLGHGEPFAAAARADVGGADWRDVLAAVDAAVERGIADPDRLGIGGWSQGGFMSAWAVTQTRRFKAAVAGAGPTDWGMMVLTSDMPGFERELGGSAPWDAPEPHGLHHHATLSPITFARNVATPVLILHGEKDERVPLSQATGFHRALREVGVPVEFVVYPREPHGIKERAHQIDLLRRVRSWYDRWLRG